jgi:hypothetical protein
VNNETRKRERGVRDGKRKERREEEEGQKNGNLRLRQYRTPVN